MLPIAAGPMLLHPPVSTIWLFISLANIVTVIDHSGFNFPLIFDTTSHDLHHQKFIFNYGGCGWLDFIHNTMYHSPTDEITKKKLK